MLVVNTRYTEQLHGQLEALINCIAEQTTTAEVTTTGINERYTGCTLLFMICVDRRSMLRLSNYNIQQGSLHLQRRELVVSCTLGNQRL